MENQIVAGSNEPLKNCVCGEIGKHEGLKIPWQKCLVGSSPTLRTISVKHAVKEY